MIQAFESYWTDSKKEAFSELCKAENINPKELEKLLNHYAFANRLPREQEIVDSLNFKPKILERKPIIERVGDKIKSFIDTFIEGMVGGVFEGGKNLRGFLLEDRALPKFLRARNSNRGSRQNQPESLTG